MIAGAAKARGSAERLALEALLSARRGDLARAHRSLAAARRMGRTGWIESLSGALLARQGRLDEALRRLDAGLGAERSPWALAERADVLNRLGRFPEALRDLDRARRLAPASPEADRRAAAILLEQAEYEQARRRLDRALSLAAPDASLLARRGEVRLIQGDVAGARRDIERAWRLAPGDPRLRIERLRLMILGGALARAEAWLGELGLGPGGRCYWLGYLRCRQGRWRLSRGLFARAAKILARREPDLARRASFYALVAGTLAEIPPRPRARSRELVLTGLGYRQPFQVTREAIGLLRDCDMIFSNLSDPMVADFLGLFPIPVRAIVFRRRDRQSVPAARSVRRGFESARRVGLVTRGHPLFYGRLAYRVIQDCRRAGIGVRVPGTVSLMDAFLALAAPPQGSIGGLQVRDSSRLARIDPRLPLVVYNFKSPAERPAQCRPLRRLYPRGQRCHLLAGSGDRELAPLTASLRRVPPLLGSADPAVTLLVEPRR